MRIDFALSAEQRADARRALSILTGSGITLEQAAASAVQGKRALVRLPVADVVDRFMRSRLGTRPATVQWYEERLKQITERFGDCVMDTVTRGELRDWLAGLKHRSARAANARAARALWLWSIKQDPPLAASNITIGLEFTAPARGEIVAFPVKTCAAIMAGAGRHRDALALMLFAGIRPEEVCSRAAGKAPLLWSAINQVERMIRVPAEVSKTGRARILEGLPDAVWNWLQPGTGPVSRFSARAAVECAQRAGGITDWPHDGLRHTFASYAVAFTGDPGRVSLWLGHEGKTTLLHNHYRGIVTKAEAERFFALAPLA